MHEAKKSRKRKRKTTRKDGSQNEEARSNNQEEDVSTGMHHPTVASPQGIHNLTEYRASQPFKLRSLKSEIVVSMEEALHCVSLAIVSVHVDMLAKR
jgi:hypothetical protein